MNHKYGRHYFQGYAAGLLFRERELLDEAIARQDFQVALEHIDKAGRICDAIKRWEASN